jgi:hypothetical protein
MSPPLRCAVTQGCNRRHRGRPPDARTAAYAVGKRSVRPGPWASSPGLNTPFGGADIRPPVCMVHARSDDSNVQYAERPPGRGCDGQGVPAPLTAGVRYAARYSGTGALSDSEPTGTVVFMATRPGQPRSRSARDPAVLIYVIPAELRWRECIGLGQRLADGSKHGRRDSPLTVTAVAP